VNPYAWPFVAMWVGWAAIWAWLAPDVKATARRESVASRAAHIAPLALAVWLLAWPGGLPRPLAAPIWPRGLPGTAIGAALTLIGLAFAVAARMRLGRNWSGTVTLKQDHQLVTDGPYALVRHPIYTGLLTAVVGSAIAVDAWRALLAVVLVVIAFARKMRLEEQWMREVFGASYDDYRRRVPALVPGLRP
jgi:protein-S-isoprenylcysteine O-methyltransferase Ste14